MNELNVKMMDTNYDIIISGKIASGKDTIAEMLRTNKDYKVFRLSGTIKQIIMEKHNLNHIQLENLKRTNPDIRKEHHTVGEFLSEYYEKSDDYSNMRLKQLMNRTAFDLYNIKNKDKLCISDIRTLSNIQTTFDNVNKPTKIILLSRSSVEYRKKIANNNHYTDIDLFTEDNLKIIINHYFNVLDENRRNMIKLIFVLNDDDKNININTEKLLNKLISIMNNTKNNVDIICFKLNDDVTAFDLITELNKII